MLPESLNATMLSKRVLLGDMTLDEVVQFIKTTEAWAMLTAHDNTGIYIKFIDKDGRYLSGDMTLAEFRSGDYNMVVENNSGGLLVLV